MDPVTAFGLAGSVATFVDFGMKFVKLTWAIYHDEDDSSQVAELVQLTKTFEEAAKSVKPSDVQPTNSSEDRLHQLVLESVDFSNKLVERLRLEGLVGTQKQSTRKAFRTALRHMFRNKQLQKLKDKIVDLEHQLSLQLLISLRQFATQTLQNQETILAALRGSPGHGNNPASGIQTILQHITTQMKVTDKEQWQNELRNSMAQQIYEAGNLENASKIVLTELEIKQMNQTILSALKYTSMGHRQHQIETTFGTTFDWTLSEDHAINQKWHSLPEWLVSNESIYWISGKLGSGKSTLVKYLSSPTMKGETDNAGLSRCHPFLSRWAGDRRLVVAQFYFWAADATRMQNSRSGLLRTVLYHVLAARTDLILGVLPLRWEALAMTGEHQQLEEWTDAALQDYVLCALKALGTSNSCICLFIDGLDEFHGDPKLVIDLIHSLSSSGEHVKLCIASRPWIEFQDAFELERHLLLEDLTHEDITFFVTRKFNENREFAKLQIRESEYAEKLISDVVSKGTGVFLWVVLVVSSLISGITNADRIEDLQRRLELIPPDLENLYERILDGPDKFYHEHRAHMIMLMESAEEALPLLVFALADESSFSSFLALPPEPKRSVVLDARMDAMRRRLNSRWKGLLEVNNKVIETGSDTISRLTVEYLHKSVKDFIQSTRVQTYLSKYTSPSFDPHFQLCLAYCGYVKSQQNELDRYHSANLAFRHAAQVSKERQKEMLGMIMRLSQIPRSIDPPIDAKGVVTAYSITEFGVVAYFTTDNDDVLNSTSNKPNYRVHATTPKGLHPMSPLYRAITAGFLIFPMQEDDVQALRYNISQGVKKYNPVWIFMFEIARYNEPDSENLFTVWKNLMKTPWKTAPASMKQYFATMVPQGLEELRKATSQ